MSWFGRRRRESEKQREFTLRPTTHAEGAQSVAIGPESVVGAVLVGDNAQAIVLPPDAFRPIAEVDAVPGISNLPADSGHFVGREHELARLDTALAVTGPVLVQAVHGLGGIGKTTLVTRWAHTRAHGLTPMWWITAEDPARVQQGLAKLAAALQPAVARVLTEEQLTDRALQWLATHSGWLLVLDNVEDPTHIEEVLARARSGRIVLTSRLGTGWARTGATVVHLGVLDPVESRALLHDIVTGGGTKERTLKGAVELCHELGYLPLAIEQVGAYLEQNTLTPVAYLALLARYPAQMYQHGGEHTKSERTIARIWRVTMDRIIIKYPAAAEVLRAVAWYAPEAIPFTLLDGLAEPPALHTALGALAAYSMITLDPTMATVSVHRLVQAVARTPDPQDPQRTPALIERSHDRASTTLRDVLSEPETLVDWPAVRILLPHIAALIAHTTEDTIITTNILVVAVQLLSGQGATARAIEYAERALASCERIFGPEQPRTLTARNDLAHTYQAAGRLDEATILLEQNLADRERILGVEHPHTLTSRNNLAYTYGAAGRLDEAITLFEQTVTDRERILGVEHPHTLTARNSLASTYAAAGRLDEAITLSEQNLTDCERLLGVEHPNTLTSRNDLAHTYQAARRLDEATILLEQNLADRERILGVEHPHTLTSRNSLAYMYGAAGRLNEAITLFERNLTDCERILGIEHPGTLTSRNNLAYMYRAAGRLDEAITLFEQTVTDRERLLGVEHPDTLTSRKILTQLRSQSL
ncbi:FxSxx-COOH system tetratricopeptide repeat protein [Nocardia jejuensis]|uniref:FxSxx-COOH system tetratricopeptide repeat protein n=1 Tax=Nocardia jejuensis TaxID=328049 RepID=UPI00082F0C4C|nr:FxSxx-COOH system tetratricopeptide repeat protein [Nocardia jejuensis]